MKHIPFVSVAVSVLSFVAVAHAQTPTPSTAAINGARIPARIMAATPIRLADGRPGYAYRVTRLRGSPENLTVVEAGATRLYHTGDFVEAVYDQGSVSLLSPLSAHDRGAERHATNNGR